MLQRVALSTYHALCMKIGYVSRSIVCVDFRICAVSLAYFVIAFGGAQFMFGGTPAEGDVWDFRDGGGNGLLWRVPLGGTLAGAMTAAGDRILIGTNAPIDAPDRAILLCLDSRTAKTIWKITHPRLSDGVADRAHSPLASRPFVDGERIFYMSNRGELCCAGLKEGRSIWQLDLPKELGVYKRDPMDGGTLAPSPIVDKQFVYCITGNGATNSGAKTWRVLHPEAPSFIAVDKSTGKLAWSSNAPAGGSHMGNGPLQP